MSNQPQGCKLLGDAVLVHRGSNAVAALLQACRAVGHTDTDADHIGHLQVVVTVAKAEAAAMLPVLESLTAEDLHY